MKLDWSRLLGWVVPLACITIAGNVIVRARTGLKSASQELSEAQLAESTAALAKDKAEAASGTVRRAAVAPDRQEQTLFLKGMRSYATSNHVQITKWASGASEPIVDQKPAGGSLDATTEAADPAIKSILMIKGEITLLGPYQGIRNFLNKLARSSRLYTFTNIHWTRKDPGVEVVATLIRYVDPTLTTADAASRNQGRS